MTAITLKSLAEALRSLADEVEAGRFGAMKTARRRNTRRDPGQLEAARLDAVREFLASRTEVSTGDIVSIVFGERGELTRSAASQIGWLMKRVDGWRKVRTEEGWRYRKVS